MLQQAFVQLSKLLQAYQPLWQQQAFVERQLSWVNEHNALYEHLQCVDDSLLRALQESPALLLQYLQPQVPGLSSLTPFYNWPWLKSRDLPPVDRFYPRGIPGRKWLQLQAFSQKLRPCSPAYVDWCSGKGYLGRYLSVVDKQSVHCLEWSADLVELGREYCQQYQVKFSQQDVLMPNVSEHLERGQHIVALHACGDLHQQLLKLGAGAKVRGISLAPCCYQKTAQKVYHPLSVMGANSGLELSKADLHSAVQETVTAPLNVQKKRRQLQAWRLGFDLWQRDIQGKDEYLSTPSLPQSSINLGFDGFCQKLAQLSGLDERPGYSQECDFSSYEEKGWQRFELAERLDLIRQVFRRPLELWLVLDKALFLEEQGYSVEVGQFCERQLSPRNLMIQARRLN